MSVGDGYNDLNMIQRADVGIGIIGTNESKAVDFADLAIYSFQDLRRLIFWHGSRHGANLVYLVICKIYVAVYIIFSRFGLQRFSGMSATSEIHNWMRFLYQVIFFNILITAWALLSKDFNDCGLNRVQEFFYDRMQSNEKL